MADSRAMSALPLPPPGRTRRSAWRWFAGALIALPLAALVLAALVLSPHSDVPPAETVALADVQHALAVLRAHDPRRAPPGAVTAAALNERDLALLMNHGAHRAFGGRAEVRLSPGVATLHASQRLRLDRFGFAPWVNVVAELQQRAGLPELVSLRLGRLPLPTALAEPLLARVLVHWGVGEELLDLRDVIQRVIFGADSLTLVYRWEAGTSARLLSALTPAAERERLRAYSDRLVTLAAEHAARAGDQPLALTALIGPIFELARTRSEAGGDAANENRAAILTLALYTTGRGVVAIVPAAHDWPRPLRLPVQLAGRDDFPLHFMISAALAMEGTNPLVNAIGLAKEVADSQRGSGFSFNDLAANKAGLRFGRMALEQPEALQRRLAGGVSEKSLMPDTADLPEFLSQAEFTARFGGVDAPGYQRLLADIERRIGGLTLYR
jgi:hypothetical protein